MRYKSIYKYNGNINLSSMGAHSVDLATGNGSVNAATSISINAGNDVNPPPGSTVILDPTVLGGNFITIFTEAQSEMANYGTSNIQFLIVMKN